MKNIGIFIAVSENDRARIIEGRPIDDWGSAHIWVSSTVGYELNLCWDGENCSAYYEMTRDNENDEVETDFSDPVHCNVDFAADDWEQQLAKELLELAWR